MIGVAQRVLNLSRYATRAWRLHAGFYLLATFIAHRYFLIAHPRNRQFCPQQKPIDIGWLRYRNKVEY